MSYVPTERKPTGVPAAPLIMVSGEPKSGKSRTSYMLGNSPRIANCWVLDLGEGSSDEYGELGGYTILEWGRTWSDFTDTVQWCVAQPVAAGLMNAVVIDSGSELWDGLKNRATARAKRSKRNAAALAADPDFEVDVSMPFWNDAKEVWARAVSPLRLASHVVGVVLVRTEVVSEVVNGVPTQKKVTSFQCEKSLRATVTAHVAIAPDHTARLVEVRSMKVSVPRDGLVLDAVNPLGHLVDLLSPAEGGFQAGDARRPVDEDAEVAEAQFVYDRIKALSSDDKAGLKAWLDTVPVPHPAVNVPDMAGDQEWRATIVAKLDDIAAGFSADGPKDLEESAAS